MAERNIFKLGWLDHELGIASKDIAKWPIQVREHRQPKSATIARGRSLRGQDVRQITQRMEAKK